MVIKHLRIKGFTLVEVTVVVSILGVIALLAIPNIKRFAIKSKRAEAIQNTMTLYSLEQAFRADNDRYGQLTTYGQDHCPAAINELNFELTDCRKLRYQYFTTTNSATIFEASAASSLVCSDGSPDIVSINVDKAVTVADCQNFQF